MRALGFVGIVLAGLGLLIVWLSVRAPRGVHARYVAAGPPSTHPLGPLLIAGGAVLAVIGFGSG